MKESKSYKDWQSLKIRYSVKDYNEHDSDNLDGKDENSENHNCEMDRSEVTP